MNAKPLDGANQMLVDRARALAAVETSEEMQAWLTAGYPSYNGKKDSAWVYGCGVAQAMIELLLGIIDADHPCEQMPLFLLPDPPAVQTPAETMLDLAGAVIAGVHGG
jgi:hypothetical protein